MNTKKQLAQIRPALKEYYPTEAWNTVGFIFFNLFFGAGLINNSIAFPFRTVIGIDLRWWGALFLFHGIYMFYLLQIKNDWRMIRKGARVGFIIKFCWVLQIFSLCIQGGPVRIYYLLFGGILLLYFQAGTYINLPVGKSDGK